MGSSRLPAKALAPIAGRPLVEWVHRRASEVPGARVVVATDHPRIAEAVAAFGGEARITRGDHPSGTSRCAEVAAALWAGSAPHPQDVVVNLQGDEPLVDPAALIALIDALRQREDVDAATLACPLVDGESWARPSVVKVVADARGRALYFSRAPIPGGGGAPPAGALRHVGVYAFRAGLLLHIPQLAPSPLEAAEDLEQLRLLWHGIPMAVVRAAPHPPGVDTPEDLERVRRLIEGG